MQTTFCDLTLADCAHLEQLTISLPASLDVYREPGFAHFVRHAPHSLAKITIEIRGWEGSAFNWVEVGTALTTLPRLRTVVMEGPTGGTLEDLLDNIVLLLKDTCEEKGEQLREAAQCLTSRLT